MILIGKRNRTVNNKLIHYLRINFSASDNYPLNAGFFFESYNDFKRKSLVSEKISIHVIV